MRPDGSRSASLPAAVDQEKIYTQNADVPIEVQDKIERDLPGGRVELLMIDDVHCWSGIGSIESFYEITYSRDNRRQREANPTGLSISVSGSPQAHVNVHSTDSSTTIVELPADEMFSRLREQIETNLRDSPEFDKLIDQVDRMERTLGTKEFGSAYKDFMATVADHVTVIAPLLPALAACL